jgi:hypothetical protein
VKNGKHGFWAAQKTPVPWPKSVTTKGKPPDCSWCVEFGTSVLVIVIGALASPTCGKGASMVSATLTSESRTLDLRTAASSAKVVPGLCGQEFLGSWGWFCDSGVGTLSPADCLSVQNQPDLRRLTVKILRLTMIAFVMLFVATQARGQEPPREHAAYAHLKVLEPVVGSWVLTGTNDEGIDYTYELTYYWTYNKSMLLGDAVIRVPRGGDEVELPWDRLAYAWNDDTKSIEVTRQRLNKGIVTVASYTLMDDGRWGGSLIRTSEKEPVTGDTFVTVSEEKITVVTTNLKNAAGEALPDTSLTLTRLK